MHRFQTFVSRIRFRRVGMRLVCGYRCAITLIASAAGLLLFAGATADATVDTALLQQTADRAKPPYLPNLDPRFARLREFFRKYSCPAPQYVEEYLRTADAYGLDYRLLPAISIRETQCGIHAVLNNHLGFHPGGDGFATALAGIEFVGKRLGEHPYYKGRRLNDLLFRYNPKPAYPGEVLSLMREIEP